jgi:ElaB/YqjD/DUF883 family membrane-anchored ribosome-binding protein
VSAQATLGIRPSPPVREQEREMNAKDQAAALREQAERTREALGETVQQLSDKLDVPARAGEGMQKVGAKAQQVAASAADKAQQVTAQAKDTAVHSLDEAERRIDDLPEAVRAPAHHTMAVVRQRPAMVLLGVAGLIVLLRLLLRRSHD